MAVTLEKLQHHMEQKLPQSQVDFFKQLAVVLFEKATAEFLDEFDLESLQAMALGALNQIDNKPVDEVRVRVFNPSYEADGWRSPYTALEISLKDRPFIVDTVRTELRRRGLRFHYFLHPILPLQRDAAGVLRRTLERSGESVMEAYELYFVDRIDDTEKMAALEQRIREILGDLVLATDDYRAKESSRKGQGIPGSHSRRTR